MSNIRESNALFWERAYLKYFGRMCALALRILTNGNWADAEDIVSEAFQRAMRYVENPEEIASVSAFMWVIVKRVWLAKLARERPALMVSLDELTESREHPTVEPSAERDLELKELIKLLRASLGPLKSREVTLLRLYLRGYKPKDMAAELKEDVRITRVDFNALKAKLRYRLMKAKANSTWPSRP
jgi:RNA polymerase sigma factor (sigma-70 family)